MTQQYSPSLDEWRLLGAVLRAPYLAAELNIDPDLFTSDERREFFELLRDRFQDGLTCNPTTIAGLWSDRGARSFTTLDLEKTDGFTVPQMAKGLLPVIRERRLRMRFDSFLRRTHTALREDHDADLRDLLQDVMLQCQELLSTNLPPWVDFGPELERQADAELRRIQDKSADRLLTGMRDFDGQFGGISRRGVTLVIAATGMGKTSVANRMALGLAWHGWRVLLHGTETSVEERVNDMLFGLAGVDPRRWVEICGSENPAHDYQRYEWGRALEEAKATWATLPILVSGAGATVDTLASRAATLRRAGKIDIVIDDYLQDHRRINRKDLPGGDMHGQVAHSSATLKELAARHDLPVVTFAQRSGEKEEAHKTDPVPQLHHVRWAMEAAHDAEECLALYRDDYYAERVANWAKKGKPGYIEFHGRKIRRGELRMATEQFHGPTKWVGARLTGGPRG